MNFLKNIAVVLLVLLIPRATWCQEDHHLLVETLIKAGAEPQLVDVADWSVINNEFMDYSQMEHYCKKALDIFGAEQKYFKSSKENSKMHRILHIGGMLDSDTFLQIIIQSLVLPEEYEVDPKTYLITAISSQNLGKYASFIEKTQRTTTFFGGQSKITACVTGTFDGRLNKENRDLVLGNIYDCLEISHTKKVEDDYTHSVMGFSPLLQGDVRHNSNYNIQITMKYNLEEDNTYLWIGTIYYAGLLICAYYKIIGGEIVAKYCH